MLIYFFEHKKRLESPFSLSIYCFIDKYVLVFKLFFKLFYSYLDIFNKSHKFFQNSFEKKFYFYCKIMEPFYSNFVACTNINKYNCIINNINLKKI